MNRRVLLVDDDLRVLQGLRRQLADSFEIEIAESAREALRLVERTAPFAVVVSDMRMPGTNGVLFFSELRKRDPDSVRIMLTGVADRQTAIDAINRGNVFRFLVKPCSSEALGEAVEDAVVHYASLITRGPIVPPNELAGPDGIVMRLRAHDVRVRGEPITLTPREFALLRLLLEHRGETLTIEEIAGEVWGATIGSRGLVEVNVSRLRAKLRRLGADHALTTVRGVGYVIR